MNGHRCTLKCLCSGNLEGIAAAVPGLKDSILAGHGQTHPTKVHRVAKKPLSLLLWPGGNRPAAYLIQFFQMQFVKMGSGDIKP